MPSVSLIKTIRAVSRATAGGRQSPRVGQPPSLLACDSDKHRTDPSVHQIVLIRPSPATFTQLIHDSAG